MFYVNKITQFQSAKKLFINLEGVVCCRDMNSMYFRHGFKEGLQLLRDKTKGFLQIILILRGSSKTLKKLI